MSDLNLPIKSTVSKAIEQLKELEAPSQIQAVSTVTIDHLLDDPLIGEANPANLMLASYHGTSRKTHESRLRRIAKTLGCPRDRYEYLNWQTFTAVRIQSFLNDLYEPWIENGRSKRRSPNTLNGFLDTLKGVMKKAFKLDLIDQRQWGDIQEIRAYKNNVPLAGRMAEASETKLIEDHLNTVAKANPAKASRDRAIFRLSFLAGIRRHEFANLDIENYDFAHQLLEVRGKGGKIVQLEIGTEVIEAINHWIAFRGNESGALFFRINKTGDITEARLSPEGIRYLFQSYTTKLGIPKLTSHDGRRTFCSNVLDDPDIDPKTAMDLLRHASFNTSAKYDRRSGRKRREVANRLSMK